MVADGGWCVLGANAPSKRVDVAIGVVVSEDGQRVLIGRRPDEAVLGGFWELPGGKIEPGETPEACVVREMAEELGIAVAVGEALPVIDHAYDHGHVFLHAYYCRHVSGEPQNLAVVEHRWVETSRLADFSFPPGNDELLTRIAADLAS